MGDRIVKEIHYALTLSDSISFEEAPAVEEDYPDFKLKLERDTLTATMTTRFTTAQDAKRKVEETLRAWELDYMLANGAKDISFQFKNIVWQAEDEHPSDGKRILHAEVGEFMAIGNTVSFHLTRRTYPAPPRKLAYTPDVKSLAERYLGYLAGTEPLLSMGYFCWTLLKDGENLDTTAGKYSIDKSVLKKLGDLTSNRGNTLTARKFSPGMQDLSPGEEQWVKAAIALLIRRKSEYDFNPGQNFSQITLSSLPAL